MDLPALVSDSRCGFRIWRQASAVGEAAMQALLPDPDTVLARGDIRKPGSRTHGALVEVAGGRYFLKRYNCRGTLYRLQNAVRRSRALYTWQLAWAFLARGVPVPVPLVCLEERRLRLLGRSYVLMEAAAGDTLRCEWPRLGEVRRDEVLDAVGMVLGRMHRQGCLHGDLKWDNILLREQNGTPDVRLVDLDGGRLLPVPWRWLALKDLERFVQDLKKAEDDPRREIRLQRAWEAGWSGAHEG